MIFSVTRIPRLGQEELGDIRVTEEFASEEAGLGRGLLIGGCCETAVLRHASQAAMNGWSADVVLVPSSYDALDVLAEAFTREGVDFWTIRRDGRDGAGKATAKIQVAVPERLYLVGKHVESADFQPTYIHVVDPTWHLRSEFGNPYGSISCRGDNVARFKAGCEAKGVAPYAIFWTCEPPASILSSALCKMMGVDALCYGDGKSVRTASFCKRPLVCNAPVREVSHWLEDHIHGAFVRRPALLLVLKTHRMDPSHEVGELARIHGYPCVDAGNCLVTSGIDRSDAPFGEHDLAAFGEAVADAVRRKNRQVTVLLGLGNLWDRIGEDHVIRLLADAARHSVLVIAVSSDSSRRSLLAAARMAQNSLSFPLTVAIAPTQD